MMVPIDATDHFSGDNHLMSVGVSKNDAVISAGKGLASSPAVSIGDAAIEDLTAVFRLTNTGGENVFNVSVNGISGVIEIPTGFYVGSTLAEALQNRINQIQDPVTGDTVGGVTVKYNRTQITSVSKQEQQVTRLQLKLRVPQGLDLMM